MLPRLQSRFSCCLLTNYGVGEQTERETESFLHGWVQRGVRQWCKVQVRASGVPQEPLPVQALSNIFTNNMAQQACR